jgi:hypothetical protein
MKSFIHKPNANCLGAITAELHNILHVHGKDP